jgi:hypothetical protein
LYLYSEDSEMKDLLEVLAKLWTPISRAPWWARGLATIAIALVVVEVAQDGFLGSSLFWIAARVAPWSQILEPNRVIATTYGIRSPGATTAEDADGRACPIGSKVNLTFARSADGWVAVAGWNAKEGVYAISKDGLSPQPIEREKVYAVPFEITSSAGEEYFIVLGKSKPFDSKKYLELTAEQLKLAATNGKGGTPQLRGVDLERVDAGRLGSCKS